MKTIKSKHMNSRNSVRTGWQCLLNIGTVISKAHLRHQTTLLLVFKSLYTVVSMLLPVWNFVAANAHQVCKKNLSPSTCIPESCMNTAILYYYDDSLYLILLAQSSLQLQLYRLPWSLIKRWLHFDGDEAAKLWPARQPNSHCISQSKYWQITVSNQRLIKWKCHMMLKKWWTLTLCTIPGVLPLAPLSTLWHETRITGWPHKMLVSRSKKIE